MLMPCRSALKAKTNMVERITDAKGAPADTQNSLGFFKLYQQFNNKHKN